MALTRFTDRYCNVELAKTFAADSDGVEDNATMGAMIRAASRFVETYTNQYWGPSAYLSNELIPKIVGNFNNEFYVRWAPVLHIDLLYDDVRGVTNPYVLGTDFEIDLETGKVDMTQWTLDGTSDVVPGSFSTTALSLYASYAVGQGPAPSAVPNDLMSGIAAPEDVQLATAMIAGSLMQYGDRGDIRQRTKMNESVTFQDAAIPVKAKWLLDQHRRFV